MRQFLHAVEISVHTTVFTVVSVLLNLTFNLQKPHEVSNVIYTHNQTDGPGRFQN